MSSRKEFKISLSEEQAKIVETKLLEKQLSFQDFIRKIFKLPEAKPLKGHTKTQKYPVCP